MYDLYTTHGNIYEMVLDSTDIYDADMNVR